MTIERKQDFFRLFGRPFVTIRFDEKPIFKTLLGLTPYCDYKITNAIHADSAGVYTGEKLQN